MCTNPQHLLEPFPNIKSETCVSNTSTLKADNKCTVKLQNKERGSQRVQAGNLHSNLEAGKQIEKCPMTNRPEKSVNLKLKGWKKPKAKGIPTGRFRTWIKEQHKSPPTAQPHKAGIWPEISFRVRLTGGNTTANTEPRGVSCLARQLPLLSYQKGDSKWGSMERKHGEVEGQCPIPTALYPIKKQELGAGTTV